MAKDDSNTIPDRNIVPPKAVSQSIKDARAMTALSQKKFGDLAGVTGATVSRIENGQGCRTRTLGKVVQAVEELGAIDKAKTIPTVKAETVTEARPMCVFRVALVEDDEHFKVDNSLLSLVDLNGGLNIEANGKMYLLREES
tara:strand:+ start:439 stop:864 length:426 start_codon:yes stop_codon:yes gene_type:complete